MIARTSQKPAVWSRMINFGVDGFLSMNIYTASKSRIFPVCKWKYPEPDVNGTIFPLQIPTVTSVLDFMSGSELH